MKSEVTNAERADKELLDFLRTCEADIKRVLDDEDNQFWPEDAFVLGLLADKARELRIQRGGTA